MDIVKDYQGIEEEQDSEYVQSKAQLQDIFACLTLAETGVSVKDGEEGVYRRPDLGKFITTSDFHATFAAMDEDKNGCYNFIEFEKYCLKS